MGKLERSPHTEVLEQEVVRKPDRRFAALICGIPVVITLLTGCMFQGKKATQETINPEAEETIENEFNQENTAPTIGDYTLEIVDPNKEVTLPWDAIIPSIDKETGLFSFIQPDSIKTVKDLAQIETLDLYYRGESEDLSWLRYCENLTDLSIRFLGEYSKNKIQIGNIAYIPNLEKLTIAFPDEFSFRNYGFLLESSIKELELVLSGSSACPVDKELLAKLQGKISVTITGESYVLTTTNDEAAITIDGNSLGEIDWDCEISVSPNTISNYSTITNGTKLYAKDLASLEELTIRCDGSEDLSWLKYCINLKQLRIDYTDDYNLSNNVLSALTKIPNLEMLTLSNVTNVKKQDYDCLNRIITLTKLTIHSSRDVPVNADFSGITNLDNIEELILYYNSPNIYIYFPSMEKLETLTFGNSPYTVAIEFDDEMCSKLKEKGCVVEFLREEDMRKFMEANILLNEIVDSFNLKENASDADKLDAMLCWILENFRYSTKIAAIDRTIGITQEEAQEMENQMLPEFYEDGLLTAYFEGNGTEICGNYAAMFEALAHRVNFNSSYVESEEHAYNLVVFEGEYYYVDATWLDPVSLNDEYYDAGNAEVIRAGNGMDLVWYLCPPQDVLTHDDSGSHTAQNIPTDFDFNDVKTNTEEENTFDITGKLVEFVVNGKKYIMPAALFMGFLIGVGIARKKSRTKKRSRQEADYDEYGDDNDLYGTAYGDDYGPYDDGDDDDKYETRRRPKRWGR